MLSNRAMQANKKRLKQKAVEGVKAAAARIKASNHEVLDLHHIFVISLTIVVIAPRYGGVCNLKNFEQKSNDKREINKDITRIGRRNSMQFRMLVFTIGKDYCDELHHMKETQRIAPPCLLLGLYRKYNLGSNKVFRSMCE
jgi:hypothetical protein